MLTMSPFAGVIIRQRQSSEMTATHCPVRSMGAAARGGAGAAVPPRACAACVVRAHQRKRQRQKKQRQTPHGRAPFRLW